MRYGLTRLTHFGVAGDVGSGVVPYAQVGELCRGMGTFTAARRWAGSLTGRRLGVTPELSAP
jgi:hypothetical protein